MSETVVLADRYELHEVLGRGGMADVYRATDRLLSRQVAVKVLRDAAGDETDRLRFTHEARTLARLSHPGLVMVLDAGITSEQPFLVMELVEGSTLSQLCASGPVDPSRARTIGARVADALAYAHAQGIVHRDVKPGNVLLGTDRRVKLADFGIARLIGDTVRHTRTGLAIGTAAYLAPEQVRGEELTTAADVYSLGLVLLEALTGQRAYPGTPTEAALARLARAPHVPADLPDDWPALLTAMTALAPADRPGAAEVAERLGVQVGSQGRTQVGSRNATVGATRVLPAAGPRTSFIDRAGDSLARQPARLLRRLSALDAHHRGVAGAVAALVLLLVIVAIAADTDSASGGADRVPSETSEPSEPAPSAPSAQPKDDKGHGQEKAEKDDQGDEDD
jgi:serine/threonine protein kinase